MGWGVARGITPVRAGWGAGARARATNRGSGEKEGRRPQGPTGGPFGRSLPAFGGRGSPGAYPVVRAYRGRRSVWPAATRDARAPGRVGEGGRAVEACGHDLKWRWRVTDRRRVDQSAGSSGATGGWPAAVPTVSLRFAWSVRPPARSRRGAVRTSTVR